MNPELLGGHKNAHETKQPSDNRLENQEARLAFQDLREKFARQAVTIFSSTEEGLMKDLRSHALFQRLKEEQRFDDVKSFEKLAAQFPQVEVEYELEDSRQQAALLSMIAQADAIQDESLLESAELENKA